MRHEIDSTSLGIDFGTSNSSVAHSEGKNVQVFNVAPQGREAINQPSSIFIRADGYSSVGFKAVGDFHGPASEEDAYHFIPSIKRGLPHEDYEGNLLISRKKDERGYSKKTFYSVEELAAMLIVDLKIKAERYLSKGEAKSVVLGRPVVFSEDEQEDQLAEDRLRRAASLAGFENINFLPEPVAAALSYENSHPGKEGRKIFVFDFGGGTLDTTIIRTSYEKGSDWGNNVISSHGINLGGADFDRDIFKAYYLVYFAANVTWGPKKLPMPAHIHQDILDWHLMQHRQKETLINYLEQGGASDTEAVQRLVTLVSNQQVFSLLQNIESAKIQVSNRGVSIIKHQFGNINIETKLDRVRLREVVVMRKKEILGCVTETLKRGQVKAEEIDIVVKVGGSSNISFVRDILIEIFNQVEDYDSFTSIVSGLSLAANKLFR